MAAAAAAAAAASTKPKLLSSKPLVFNLLHTLSFLAIACNAGVAAKAIVQPSEKLYRRELQAATNVPVFCVAKSNADSSQLQNALDWTCGSGSSLGSVDCSAIQQGGSCYQPDTVASHASYAFTLYYYKQNGASGSCNFNGLATLTQTSPSSGTCVYPSSATSSSTTPSSPSSLNSTGLSPPFSTTFPFLDSPAPTPSGSSYTTVTASSFHGVSTFLYRCGHELAKREGLAKHNVCAENLFFESLLCIPMSIMQRNIGSILKVVALHLLTYYSTLNLRAMSLN